MAKLIFDCTGASAAPYTATPTLLFRLNVTEGLGERVDAIALRCQIRIEPHKRRYSPDEARRLHDLFGDTDRWAETVKAIQLAAVSVMVPAFTGQTEVSLEVPCTYDLEVASGRYLQGLDDGTIPLLLLFSGTIFGQADGRLQVQQVPWSKETTFRLPVSLWREAVDVHFPDAAWITMSRHTLDELIRFKTRHALPTWDATVATLLAQASREES